MKRSTAIALYQAILGVSLDKMNEEMTDAILANTLAVAGINDSLVKAQEELRKRTVETIDKDRLAAYDELTTKMNALEGVKRMAVQAVINDNYKDVKTQLKRLNKAISAWLDKDADVDLTKIDRKEFCKACRESEQSINPAVMQTLAPMFKDYKEPKAEVDADELDELLND